MNGVVARDLTDRMSGTPDIPELSNREVSQEIHKDSGARLVEVDILSLLRLARDLSREVHEGMPRSFSFILGSPEWLISELSVVYDLVDDKYPYRLVSPPADPCGYQRTIALLRGNSTFLQDERLALFIPYPGRPLEITHVVGLPGVETRRRELLAKFTAERYATMAIATYGNGLGEVLHNREVKGILSIEGHWVRVVGYRQFKEDLQRELLKLMSEERCKLILGRLEPAIRTISEDIGTGAIFVLAGEKAVTRLLKRSRSLTSVLGSVDGRPVDHLSLDLIYDLARDDGAAIISLDSLRMWGRRHLPAFPIEDLEQHWIADGDLRWDGWVRTLKWGTRHRTALGVSRWLKAAGLVIVISADGPINVLQGGRGVAEFGESSARAVTGSTAASRAHTLHTDGPPTVRGGG